MNWDEREVKQGLNELADAIARVVPHKKHKKSTHKGFGTVTDPKVGAATAIKPGEVRNPGGRPKSPPMTDALRKLLMSPLPAKYAKEFGMPSNLTWAAAVAWSCLYNLIKHPNPHKFAEYAGFTDGPLVTDVSAPLNVLSLLDLNVDAESTAHEQLQRIAVRFRERLAKSTTAS